MGHILKARQIKFVDFTQRRVIYGIVKRMPKRSSKDVNRIAHSIVERVGGRNGKETAQRKKNPAAVSLGRLGGLKGGRARAQKLSAEERSAIARIAAQSRWEEKN